MPIGSLPIETFSTVTMVEPDLLTMYVLPYINYIMMGVAVFIILYCARKYMESRRKVKT